MTKVQELQQEMTAAMDAAQAALDAGKMEEAKQQYDTLRALKEAIAVQQGIDAERKAALQTDVVPKVKEKAKSDAVKAFADAARVGFRNSMSEGVDADGGYTVPMDIQTKINTYRDAEAYLIDEVDVEKVSTLSGQRTYKKRAQQAGFAKVAEGGKIGVKNTPQFERMSYQIEKYAGAFPVTNELLKDSDANIVSTLIAWIGGESRVTRNKLILEEVKKQDKTALTGLDDIKKALNVTLGQAFKQTSKIITNDDGLQYLDTLKDQNGRDLLQPNPTEPAKLQLRVGATVVPIRVVPNGDLPSDEGTAGKRGIPMIIGDLKEGIKFFDRELLTITSSDVAAIGNFNAYEQDMTLFRAIERECVRTKDSAAFVYGQITVNDASVVGTTPGGNGGQGASGGENSDGTGE